MIQVSVKGKHALVYSVVTHHQWGPMVKPYVVQLTPNGRFSLVFEHLISENIKFYPHLVDEDDRKIIELLDRILPEAISRKFSVKQKIRPSEFFEKHMSQLLYKQSIKPYIDRNQAQALALILKKNNLYLFDYKNPTSKKLEIPETESSILFHFRRNEQGTNYFITIKNGENVYSQFNKDSLLLSSSPCWLLTGNQILHFNQDLDGQKIAPFLQKNYLNIAPASEEQFFKKFALPLLEQYQVLAKGIRIETEQYQAKPIIRLDNMLNGKQALTLLFKYGKQLFQFHSGKNVSAILSKENGELVIKKIRRSRQWEKQKFDTLISFGFQHLEHSYFNASKSDALYDLIELLSEKKKELEAAGFEIRQQLNLPAYFIGDSALQFSVKQQGDWFDIRATVNFGSFQIPFVHLRRHIMAGNREFPLPDGSIAIIPVEWFERLTPLFENSEEGEKIKLKSLHVGLIQEQMAPFVLKEDKQQLARDFEKIPEIEIPAGFKGSLRVYQKAGYDWFYFLQQFGFGGCLADDMGLGKTIQTLALLLNEKELYLKKKKSLNPTSTEEDTINTSTTENTSPQGQLDLFSNAPVRSNKSNTLKKPINLLVVPASLIFNWIDESQKFTPTLRFLNHTGFNRSKSAGIFEQYDVIITTYGTLRNDLELLSSILFNYIILDESQLVKNAASQTAKSIRSLHGKNRITLTGTPLENSVVDLWSQMNFLNPGLLGGINSFKKNYIQPIEKEQNPEKLQALQAILKPFILRRTKNQVASDLPEKTEQVIYCEMQPEQKSMYEKVKSSYRNEILKNIAQFGINKSRMHVIKGLTELRQIANHPSLTADYDDDSGKFQEITRMAITAVEEGHKVLLFSQFVRFLSMFKQYFSDANIPFCYLDGNTQAKERERQVKLFQQTNEFPIFLISLKAGGTGLNLTEADYVFIADPWWNPATERQAIDRSHRIGQKNKVFSYKFISLGTVEEKILGLQKRKQDLSNKLIQSEDSFVKQLSASDIEILFT